MNKTNISWTDFSSNPLRYKRKSDGKVVNACVRCSPGCARCYSETITLRYDRGKLFNAANMEELEPFLDEGELHQLLTRKTCGGLPVSGGKVFIGDMTDVAGEWVPDVLLDRMFAVFALRPDVTFQVLTKRAERMQRYITTPFVANRVMEAMTVVDPKRGVWAWPGWDDAMRRVWLGVSVENQAYADARIPHLLQTPAAVRFLSCEPLLGAIEFSDVSKRSDAVSQLGKKSLAGIDWTICGAESGANHRPCQVEWIESIARQCQEAGVPCFIKQDAGPRPGMQGRIPDDLWALKQFPERQATQ